MNAKNEKHLDLELSIFFLFVAILSFLIYIIRHPLLTSNFLNISKLNSISLFLAYIPDLVIFLIILVPYLVIIISLIIIKIIKKVRIPDNVMVILFFPLLSFFTKGMSLMEIYVETNSIAFLLKVLKNNFAFFSFLFIGPIIIAIHGFVIRLKKKNKTGEI